MTRDETFPAVAPSVGAARQFVGHALVGSSGEVMDDVKLMVSELATNVIEHALTGFHLAVQRTPQEIRVEVTDYGGGIPTMRPMRADALDGRGLRIVDTLATHWGISGASGYGKTVWFSLSLTNGAGPAAVAPLHSPVPLAHPAGRPPANGTRAALRLVPPEPPPPHNDA